MAKHKQYFKEFRLCEFKSYQNFYMTKNTSKPTSMLKDSISTAKMPTRDILIDQEALNLMSELLRRRKSQT